MTRLHAVSATFDNYMNIVVSLLCMTKTLILGLDGATFDVLDPLIEEGLLPNIEQLRHEGASGILQSTMPPVTGPAWLSLTTGQSPGRTGIYDFIYRNHDDEGFDFKYMDGTIFQGQSLWDYLGAAGYEVGVVDFPMLSPPYEVNGFIVCGGMGSTGHACYPEALDEELADFEKPEEHLELRDEKYDDLSVFMDDIIHNLERRRAIVEYVLAEKEWEVCWPVFQEPDWVSHLMWKCFDEDYPEHDDVTDDERELFREFWVEIDDIVGTCLSLVDDDTNVIIQSDHGFGPMYNKSFRLNTWLVKEGYMVPKSFAGGHWKVKKSIWNLLSDVADAVDLKERAPRLFKFGKNATSTYAMQLGAIDLEETRLFDPGHIGSMGGLYINDAVVTDEQEVAALKAEVTEKLQTFAAENEIDMTVYDPEELYGGTVAGSPDLIVRVAGWMIEDGGWEEPVIDERPPRLNKQNGSHRSPGVLIAAGPDFEAGEFDEANVWDLAPTLLHCYGERIPKQMDGEVLTDILAFVRPVERSGEALAAGPAGDASEEDRRNVQEQLSDLGYFE